MDENNTQEKQKRLSVSINTINKRQNRPVKALSKLNQNIKNKQNIKYPISDFCSSKYYSKVLNFVTSPQLVETGDDLLFKTSFKLCNPL